MNKFKSIYIVFCLLIMSQVAIGQQSIFYTGLGRAELSKDVMNEDSEFLKNDSTSDKRDLNGRFLFDLGVNVEPNESLRALAILRVTNEFGGFYSQGSALEFRQIKIEGLIGDKVNYQVGDIDLKLTDYTLINNQENYNEFESDIFKIRRQVSNYENFNVDDNWRLQGLQTNGTLLFDKVLKSADINIFGTRIKKNNFITVPDRILGGGSLKLNQSDTRSIGLNVLSISDVVGTVSDTAVDYTNTVITGSYDIGLLNKENLSLALNGEFGTGLYDYNKIATSQRQKSDDYFYDLGAGLKASDIKVNAGYRYVGPRFYSPGAQTLRLDNSATAGLFPVGEGGLTNRSANIYDRFSDLSLYNKSINPTLMNIASRYSNVSPYGKATPNRQGISLSANKGNKDSLYYVTVSADLLSEAIGVGVSEKRNFTAIYGGGQLNLGSMIGLENDFSIQAGVKMESTTRGGTANVDLQSLLIDVGAQYELVNKLDVLIGLKMLSASGREYSTSWNEFNEIQTYGVDDIDVMESVMALGLRYRFSNYNFFTMNGNLVKMIDNLSTNLNYDFSQLYFNYTLMF